ncbi:MAG TPA: PLP-dependent aminotransferase family protein [Trebonia sp.]
MTVPISAEMARIDGPALADLLGRWSAADGPLYRLLAGRIGRLADAGSLPPGTRLPPERELAAVLAVSRNTVAMAYQLLRDDGMAHSRQGSATRIVPHRVTPAAVHRANGFFTGMLEASAVTSDLTLATVDCAPQVAAALDDPASVLTAAARRELTAGTGYFPHGLPALRAAIADMLSTRHGVPTAPSQVVITTGGQQALDLLARSEVVSGQAVVTEDPTYPGALDALHRSGARLVGVPSEDVERLGAAVAAHDPSLVYLIPTHQNPIGSVLPADARDAVIALARRHPDVTFIDDLTLADLPLSDAGAPPPLAALAPGAPNIVTVGSLSKLYWGGLRVGWARAPAGIAERLAAAKAATDLGSTAYQQGLVAALVSGQHDEIVKWRGDWLRPRYDAIAAALRSALPDWAWTQPSGGLTIWARLPGGLDSGAFAQAALRRGVGVVPGRLLSAADGARSHLRLAFVLPPDRLASAVTTLGGISP